ncbi:MAG: M48 family metalloprotease, partial [Acidobacteria bacterium]|nr:M48 family metalloprotease [Acidobacteriota bacterium]
KLAFASGMARKTTYRACAVLAGAACLAAGNLPQTVAGLTNASYEELASEVLRTEISHKQIENYRKIVEKQKKEDLETLEAERKRLRSEDEQARAQLERLNKAASSDTADMKRQRRELHCRLADIAHSLADLKTQTSISIPATYANKFTKLDFAEIWPARVSEVDDAIKYGRARDRHHGDIDDIGIRRVGEGQGRDIKLGEDAVQELKTYRLMPPELQDTKVQEYVARLGGRLAAGSDLSIPLRTKVLDSPEINAFGLPGGLLLVNAGLLQAADSESELAGVMSHELAHITARHGERLSRPTASVSKALYQGAQMAADAFTGGAVSEATQYAKQYLGIGAALNLSMLGVNGDTEAEADQLGIQYAWRSGFDPAGFIEFYDKMAADSGSVRTASFFRTHPPGINRIMASFSELEYLARRQVPRYDSSEFAQARKRILTWAARRKAGEQMKISLGTAPECGEPAPAEISGR